MSDVHLRHNPFSLYDFIGYFIPGAVFLALALLLIAHIRLHLEAEKPKTECARPEARPNGALEGSSPECETRQREFPPPVKMWKDEPTRQPGLFERAHSIEASVIGEGRVAYANGVLLVVFAYVIGNLISTISKLTVENYAIGTLSYPSQFLISKNHNDRKTRPFFSRAESGHEFTGRILLFVLLLPISLFDFVCWLASLRRFYATRLSDTDRAIVERNIPKMLRTYLPENANSKSGQGEGEDKEALELMRKGDVFPSVVFAYEAKAGSHLSTLENYLALYGFFRNLAGIAIVLFWMYVWSLGRLFGWEKPLLIGALLVSVACIGGLCASIRRGDFPKTKHEDQGRRWHPNPVILWIVLGACIVAVALIIALTLQYIAWAQPLQVISSHFGILWKLLGLSAASIILYLGFVKFYRRQAEEVLLAAAVSEARDQGS